jgi:hypothetical protein
MKLVYKLIALALIAALAAPMLIKGPDGKPIMSWKDWLPDTQAIKKSVEKSIPELPVSNSTPQPTQKVYRWKDEHGVWHYSNQQQDAHKPEAQEIQLQSTNQFSMEEATPDIISEDELNRSSSTNTPTIQPPTGNISIEDVSKVIENAKNVQNIVNERDKRTREAIDRN